MSASDYEQKTLKIENFISYSVQTSRGRCPSDNISRDNEDSLTSCYLLYSIFGPLGKTASIFCMCKQCLYQIILILWRRNYSGHDGKHTVVLVA